MFSKYKSYCVIPWLRMQSWFLINLFKFCPYLFNRSCLTPSLTIFSSSFSLSSVSMPGYLLPQASAWRTLSFPPAQKHPHGCCSNGGTSCTLHNQFPPPLLSPCLCYFQYMLCFPSSIFTCAYFYLLVFLLLQYKPHEYSDCCVTMLSVMPSTQFTLSKWFLD